MTWRVEVDERAAKELHSLDPSVRRRILRFLRERVATEEDPRRIGRQLQGQSAPLWRYRVGPYRLICSIEDGRLVVLVVRVAHRREAYR